MTTRDVPRRASRDGRRSWPSSRKWTAIRVSVETRETINALARRVGLTVDRTVRALAASPDADRGLRAADAQQKAVDARRRADAAVEAAAAAEREAERLSGDAPTLPGLAADNEPDVRAGA